VRPELGVAHPREHRRSDEKRRVERGRADEDVPSDADERPHLSEPRATGVGRRTEQLEGERDAHPGLGDGRPRRGPGDPPVEPVDEQDLEDDVRRVPGDHDPEWAPEVGDAAEVPLSCQRDERRRQPDRGDPQVGECEVAGFAVAAERV
jgi:hypothetical protein